MPWELVESWHLRHLSTRHLVGMHSIDSNSARYVCVCLCSFSWRLWLIFKICVRVFPGKTAKSTELRIPIQIADNHTITLHLSSTVLLYIDKKLLLFNFWITVFRIIGILIKATYIGLNTTGRLVALLYFILSHLLLISYWPHPSQRLLCVILWHFLKFEISVL